MLCCYLLNAHGPTNQPEVTKVLICTSAHIFFLSMIKFRISSAQKTPRKPITQEKKIYIHRYNPRPFSILSILCLCIITLKQLYHLMMHKHKIESIFWFGSFYVLSTFVLFDFIPKIIIIFICFYILSILVYMTEIRSIKS